MRCRTIHEGVIRDCAGRRLADRAQEIVGGGPYYSSIANTGGPSETVGIMAGDRLVKIDGESCIGFKNNDVFKSLRGEKDTHVKVSIFRPSNTKIIDFDIVRDQIPLYLCH